MTGAGDFFNQETVLALLAGLFVGLLAYVALAQLVGRGRLSKDKSVAERQFSNVFSIMDEGRRQSLIHYYAAAS
ncbi:hypothetical protein PZN02_006097 (plasmid) [Sinorhizobium garamanticum]|uniref:Uncharacterized protein n=1 Tax=Sinorhizobium garamanticum TaxID=680247 RepID=A0ABY8DN82_9HYPH|nr:hypothetical protein [Sinorhizobium garamanticum]WEX91777.1 hypothetical protein PZN02_006097 [Sinorhizobium garamanticum]